MRRETSFKSTAALPRRADRRVRLALRQPRNPLAQYRRFGAHRCALGPYCAVFARPDRAISALRRAPMRRPPLWRASPRFSATTSRARAGVAYQRHDGAIAQTFECGYGRRRNRGDRRFRQRAAIGAAPIWARQLASVVAWCVARSKHPCVKQLYGRECGDRRAVRRLQLYIIYIMRFRRHAVFVVREPRQPIGSCPSLGRPTAPA